jgi:hypothetical protein
MTFLWGSYWVTQAQDTSSTMGKVNIASPTAASLGKYGDIPVSYHTGIPNIGIPIYTVQSRTLKLPISLSYHAGGLKVQENASWVGTNWSLLAGGCITRTVVGAPDDRGVSGATNCLRGHYSDYGYSSYMIVHNPSAYNPPPDGNVPDDQHFMNGQLDGEPDLYFFNFNGYTGKFYFNDDRTPVLVPGADFRIQPDYVSSMGFQGFIITTPDGIQYYFGKTGNNDSIAPVEITVSGTYQNSYANANAAVSSWFLNKIVSADKTDSITFQYDAEKYSYYTLSTNPVSDHITWSFPNGPWPEYNLVKNFISGVRLKKINFPNGSVSFTPASSARLDLSNDFNAGGSLYDTANTQAKALGSITIQNASGSFCKKDSFFYSYWVDSVSSLHGILATTFSSDNLHSDKYRLRLDSVQEMACDNSIKIPPYRFGYYTEHVPRHLSFGFDHWGFYNGADTNQTLIPSLTVTQNASVTKMPGASRDAAWPAMRGGALNKIIWPTGGFTSFQMEPHDTYCAYDTFSVGSLISRSAGYTLSTQTDTVTVTLSGNPYNVTLVNYGSGSGSARMDIIRPSDNTSVYGLFVNSGETKQDVAQVSAGTYLIKTVKNDPLATGHGVDLSMSEEVANPVSGNIIVGGLRIKSITTVDSGTTNRSIVTNYSYRINHTPSLHSTGILYSRPTYIQVLRNDAYRLVYGPNPGFSGGCVSIDGTGAHDYYKSPGSLRPMATTQGNHIGYNEVWVSQSGNGYSVYRYYGSNYWDYIINDVCTRSLVQSNSCDTTSPNYPAAPEQFDPMRGELKYEGYFTQDSQIVKDVWHYPQFQANPLTTPGFITVNLNNSQTHTYYVLTSAKKIRDSVEETMYEPGTSRYITNTSATYYTSNFHDQPTKKLKFASNKDTLTTLIQYALDLLPPCAVTTDSLPYYNNLLHSDTASMLSAMNSCTPQTGGTNSCRFVNYEQYREYLCNDRKKLINWRLNTDSSLTSCIATTKSGANYLLKPVMELHQAYQNPPIEVSNFRNNKLLKSSFTLYDYSKNPSDKVYPYIVQQLSTRTPLTDFAQAITTGSSITRDGRYRDENIMTFYAGDLVDAYPKTGPATSYVWDYQNSLPIAQVSGAADTAIAYTSFEANGSGNWTIGSSDRDTNSITGKSGYPLSHGNITKSGLIDTVAYTLSYWTKNSSAFTITGNQGTAQQGRTINGWTCFVHTLKGITSVTLSGTGIIDELRLYPKAAQMTSYTYDPVKGITSQCDMRNDITYYQYDILGRLVMVLDKDKNILKTYSYQYQEPQY